MNALLSQANWSTYAHCPVPTLLLDGQDVIVAANPTLATLLQRPTDELVGRTLAEFHRVSNLSLTPSSPNSPSPEEHCYRCGSGREIWVSQWQWATGKTGTLVQMLDISERKSREVVQAKRLDLLSRYADAVPGMVAYWQSDLRCAFANGAYREWFGKAPENMPGIHIRELLGEALFQLNEPYIRGALAGEFQQFERTLTKANGEVGYTWAQYVPDIENGQVRGFFVLVSDITILKSAQAELVKANTALAERTREAEAANQAKTLFLSMISHELRSPLHTILGYTELLQRQTAESQPAELKTIESSGKRLLRLINDILEFNSGAAAPLALHPSPLALPLFADQIAKTGALLAQRRNNRLTVEMDTNLPPRIEVDEQRLNQAVMNLVDNACKFTANGNIQVHFSKATKTPNAKTADHLVIAVKDDGPGIARAIQKTIFDTFIRAPEHRHHPGIGLGLAVVRQIVHGMRGNIRLHSRPGAGCCFEIALPIIPATANVAAPAPHPAHITGYAGTRKTLLIAEDIEENLMLIDRLCREWGFNTLLARNGNDAIRQFDHAKSISGVIVDQVMAPGDGWDVLQHIRHSGKPRTPVILVSAQIPHHPDHLPPDVRFDAALQKPVAPSALANAIAQLLKIRWQANPPAAPKAITPKARRPPQTTLRPAKQMLALGQVLALEHWAEQLAQRAPQYKDFADAVQQRCRAIDLGGVRQLIEGNY